MFSFMKPKMPTQTDALPGRTTPILEPRPHTVLGTPIAGPYPEGFQVAEFALGCFWGEEKTFWEQPGVWTTAVGYQDDATVVYYGSNYLVVWDDDRNGPNTDIYAARVTTDGVTIDPSDWTKYRFIPPSSSTYFRSIASRKTTWSKPRWMASCCGASELA